MDAQSANHDDYAVAELTVQRRFGLRLRHLRAKVGISQEELASRSRLDRSYVGSVERGERNVSLQNIWRLADALAVEPGELFRDGHD